MSKIAVIETGGKQYKISENDIIKIEKIQGQKGDKIIFDKVLLLSDEKGSDVQLGQPYLEKSHVDAEILDQGRSKKISVIKYKSKTRYRRNIGHKQYFTKVKITGI